MDRIDVLVDVARPAPARIIQGDGGTTSRQMAEDVTRAREFAAWRMRDEGATERGRQGGVATLGLDGAAQAALEGMAKRLGLGGRNIVRIARVARTIADLAEDERVRKEHVIEACAFRTRTSL